MAPSRMGICEVSFSRGSVSLAPFKVSDMRITTLTSLPDVSQNLRMVSSESSAFFTALRIAFALFLILRSLE